MKVQMTEKDKKLLIFLVLFVIVVGIGYWGVFSNVKKMTSIKKDMAKQEEEQQVNERKAVELPMLETDYNNTEKEIADVRKTFFPMMSSNEVDKYFTNMGLDYNLEILDLAITMPETDASLEPYVYASKKDTTENTDDSSDETASETTEGTGEKAEMEKVDQAANTDEDASEGTDVATDNEVSSGVYKVSVTLKLQGKQRDLERLIDDLSKSDKKSRLVSFDWGELQDMTTDANGNYSVTNKKAIQLTEEIYMCEDKNNADDEQ